MSSTETVPDPLVLAAIDRAERHDPHDRPGVPVWGIYAHLSIPKRSGPARRVRARLDALETAGSIVRARRHGIPTWALTSTGRGRLTRARRAGSVPALPESPQHRKWREARTLAAQEIERFHLSARDDVEAATDLLDALVFNVHPVALSDAWFELGERLARSFRRLGSAAYCLSEWPEPDDARADIDDGTEPSDAALDEDARRRAVARRAGRRNIRLWDTPAPGDGENAEHSRWLIALGRVIRQLRVEGNISAGELAVAAGLKPARVEAIEAGRFDPHYDVLLALARGLDVKTSDLVKRGDAEAKDGDA